MVRIVNVTGGLKEFGNTRPDFAAGRAACGLRLTHRKRPSVSFLGDERPISAQEPPNVSNALVPVTASDSPASLEPIGARPRADFLAQLIATFSQAPQTRVRRRAEPAEAVAAYGARARLPLPQRPKLSRSL
jgi:hypothetical protein